MMNAVIALSAMDAQLLINKTSERIELFWKKTSPIFKIKVRLSGFYQKF